MHVRTCGNEEIRAPRPKGAAKRAASWRRPRDLAGCKRGVASRGPHGVFSKDVRVRRTRVSICVSYTFVRRARRSPTATRTAETPETRTRDARVESATDSTLERPARSPRSPRPGTRGRPARRRTHGRPAARSVGTGVQNIAARGIMSIWTHTAMTPQTANSHAPEGWCRGFIYSSTAAPYSTCNNSHPLRGSL